jgi:hypothetical protein
MPGLVFFYIRTQIRISGSADTNLDPDSKSGSGLIIRIRMVRIRNPDRILIQEGKMTYKNVWRPRNNYSKLQFFIKKDKKKFQL